MYIGDVRFGENPADISDVHKEGCKSHRQINYDLCTALDMTKMGIVLDEMVKAGLHPSLARIYKIQAGALLAILRTENNRLFGK